MTSLAFSPDGKTLVSGGDDRTIIFWDAASGRQLRPPITAHKQQVTSLAFNPSGKVVASGSDDKTVILWDSASGRPLGAPLAGHDSPVKAVLFVDESLLLSATGDGSFIVWDVTNKKGWDWNKRAHQTGLASAAYSAPRGILASGGGLALDRGDIFLWDMTNEGRRSRLPLTGHKDTIWRVVFSPDGKSLASASLDGSIRLWDAATGRPIGYRGGLQA